MLQSAHFTMDVHVLHMNAMPCFWGSSAEVTGRAAWSQDQALHSLVSRKGHAGIHVRNVLCWYNWLGNTLRMQVLLSEPSTCEAALAAPAGGEGPWARW